MSSLTCRLLYQSDSPHLQQLYTGFRELHRSGFLILSQQHRTTAVSYDSDAPHLLQAGHAHLDAVLNGHLRLHFDTHDAQEIAVPELQQCAVYFKRSYSSQVVAGLPAEQRSKVHPLGLNYRVLPDSVDLFSARRALALHGFSKLTLSAFKQALDVDNRLNFQPRQSLMQADPDPSAAPSVLFLVAAYDPHDDPERSPDKIADREAINDTRAQCLRLLRKELGARFSGGFGRSRFTLERYPDLVASGSTLQQSYLQTLRSFPICIASTGLHGSTGWKLAEYVAFSRAIVSERLVYDTPGDFAAGRNYVEFTTPDECVAGAVRLLENPDMRLRLMQNNADYYRAWLRPDVLVRHALERALGQSRL